MILLAITAAICIIGGTVTILAALELEPYPSEPNIEGFLAGVVLIALGGGIAIGLRMGL